MEGRKNEGVNERRKDGGKETKNGRKNERVKEGRRKETMWEDMKER